MNSHKILFSNLGYARGISGELAHHLRYAHRHFYCSPIVQKNSLRQLSNLIAQEDPDICCFVEIDQGSFTSGGFNQLHALDSKKYPHFDIENKYAPSSHLRSFFLTRGKSNAFMAKHPFLSEKIYFRYGTKRLIYKIGLDASLTLFFAHLSLDRAVRGKQLVEVRKLMGEISGNVMFLGDFNILTGLTELAPLLDDSPFVLLNREEDPTFTFHKRKLVLDLCICSQNLAARTHLQIIPQPFSDHAALMVDVRASTASSIST